MLRRGWINGLVGATVPLAVMLAGAAAPAGSAPHGWGAARFGISYETLNVETPCPPTEQKGNVLICQAFPAQLVHGIHASWYLTFRDDRLIAITFRQDMGFDSNGDPSYGGNETFPRTVADIERQYGAPTQHEAAPRNGRRSAEWVFPDGATIYVEQRSTESAEFIVYSATRIVAH